MNRRILNHKYLVIKQDEHRSRFNRYNNWEINSGNTTDGSAIIKPNRKINMRSVVNYKLDKINSKSQMINEHIYKGTLEYKLERIFESEFFDD